MGFFNWAAPVFGHFADRWSNETIGQVTGWLTPYVKPGGKLLDVGGGTGALARRLAASLSARVTVLDPTPEMLRYLSDDEHITGVLGVAERMPFEDDSFDAVIVTDAFHHFRDQPGAVAEFARVVRPEGGIIVVDLDPTGVIMRAIVFGEKLLGEPGAFFTPDEMCAFMAKNGIEGHCESMAGANYRYIGTVR